MHHPTDWLAHTMAFITAVMKHWLEWEIVQWVHPEGSIWQPNVPWVVTLPQHLHSKHILLRPYTSSSNYAVFVGLNCCTLSCFTIQCLSRPAGPTTHITDIRTNPNNIDSTIAMSKFICSNLEKKFIMIEKYGIRDYSHTIYYMDHKETMVRQIQR